MSNNRTFSLHKISDADNLGFSAIEYSKFKFGDKDIARRYGHQLAEAFIRKNHMRLTKQIVVCSSPYCFIPTATYAMKDYFVQVLNEWLMNTGHPVVQELQIYRTITYKEDYGALSADERMKLIGKASFHIDASFIKNGADKLVLFLDDIKITGSHERVVARMIHDYGIIDVDHMFLYFAELVNPQIHPRIENDLNYAYVKDLLCLDKVIKNSNFLFNTRVVKYILNAPHDEFVQFIQYQPIVLVWTLYHLAIGNSYHNIEDYAANFTFLKNLVTNNQPY